MCWEQVDRRSWKVSAASCAEGTTPQLPVPSQACLLAPVCQWEHMSLGHANTCVSRPRSAHQSGHSAPRRPVITRRLLWRGRGGGTGTGRGGADADPITCCKMKRVRKTCSESEREGVRKDASVWDREVGQGRETLLLPVRN